LAKYQESIEIYEEIRGKEDLDGNMGIFVRKYHKIGGFV